MFSNDKESLNVFCISLVFLVFYIIVVIIAMRPVSSFDGFWHLQMGKDLIENGLSPWIDHYSFSFYGEEISTIPVIFQVLLYKFVSVFGENEGFYYLKVAYVTIMMSLLYVYFRRIKANWFVAFVLLPLIIYFLQARLMIRPEIFSNVLVVICLLFYLDAKKNFSTRELLKICLLLLFWVNYHSPIVGYVIIFGVFMDKAIDKYFYGDNSFSWKFWFSWGVIVFLIGFVRPNGQHFLITVYSLLTEDFAKYTNEYMSSYKVYSLSIIVHASWMLSIYVAIWSLIKKQYGFALIVVLLTYFSWSTVRLISVAMLINFCILALYLSEFYNERGRFEIRSSVKKSLIVVAAGISVWTTYILISEASASIEKYRDQEQVLESRYPVKIVEYMNLYQEGGNILNVMHLGGYLINKLDSKFKIYFDGRTNILYPIDFFKHNLFLLKKPAELNETIKKHDVKYALFNNTPEVFSQLKKNEMLELNYADTNYLLFSEKKKNAFPLSSTLLVFPSCWSDEWESGIKREIILSESLFSGKTYELQFVLAFMQDYLSHNDKKQFFDDVDLGAFETDGVRRIASYFALKEKNIEASTTIFKSIKSKNEYDILLQTYHMAQNGEYDEAEKLLYYFYFVTKHVKQKNLAFDKIAIMVHVLGILEKNIDLKKFEDTYRAELEEKLKKFDYSNDKVLSFEHLCK
ncbi:hypothetical protein MNBD_GAMMA05-2482 [hydrothermal vent metagenome]|uniref:Glycosyltransferase RgtA/B/C/D-like domain-containing protein n=1 Tax=hydrothermal vent metagenome TaxID=652676 RepID=A0A3B0WJE3_9ZZZZ